LDLLVFSVFVLLMFLTPLLGIIKYEGLHGIIYRVWKYELFKGLHMSILIFPAVYTLQF